MNAIIFYLLLAAAVFFSGLAVGLKWGYENGSEKLQELLISQASASAKLVAKQNEKVSEAERRAREATGKTRVVTERIVNEIPVYLPPTVVERCVVSNGFVLLHDAAATGSPPRPPSESDAADSGYSIAQVAETSARNLGALNQCRTQLEGVVSLYNQLKEVRK